jgi:hypothetical protein
MAGTPKILQIIHDPLEMLTGVKDSSLKIEILFEREKRLSGVTRHADG